ncbi:hypothetical protein EIP86_006788 [Pleurotus ostreatoroseus]|nr:hypothetical protein EIP86_006788 [Pleurotus ostreatoroseus]
MAATSFRLLDTPITSNELVSPSLPLADAPSTSIPSTSNIANPTSTTNQYDAGPSRTLSTVLPGFLIAFICVIAVFLIFGVFHGRRRRAMLARRMPPVLAEPPSGVLPHVRTRRKKKRAVKPKLWEADVKELNWGLDVEAIQPVAAELLADPKPYLSVQDEKRANRLLPSFMNSPPPEEEGTATQPVQITVLLAMPAPHSQIDLNLREYAIGTRCLPFRPECEADDDEKRGEESKKLEEIHRAKKRFERFAFR